MRWHRSSACRSSPGTQRSSPKTAADALDKSATEAEEAYVGANKKLASLRQQHKSAISGLTVQIESEHSVTREHSHAVERLKNRLRLAREAVPSAAEVVLSWQSSLPPLPLLFKPLWREPSGVGIILSIEGGFSSDTNIRTPVYNRKAAKMSNNHEKCWSNTAPAKDSRMRRANAASMPWEMAVT